MNSKEQKLAAFSRLLDVMDDLREKCPWDREQTLQSLRHLTIEETYELSDALLDENMPEVKKEIGDVLLHLVFYAKIASERGDFDIADVIHSLNEKLVFRHPHIYGDVVAEDQEKVKQNWESLKLKEGNRSVLAGVPQSLPPLIKAFRIQDKAHGVGFDFPTAEEAWAKVEEELHEFKEEAEQLRREEELGDLLFSLVNYARLSGLNADAALERTNRKFIARFKEMENLAAERSLKVTDLSLEEMGRLWAEAKKKEQ
ncbi:MAG: nucleoside triphosphate pyrophosphohydrolase [Chryseobacterium sp.]|nr:MAG: nucleoside triphosphate pyrophosphohydrolase [Chryseobacterium sp.]